MVPRDVRCGSRVAAPGVVILLLGALCAAAAPAQPSDTASVRQARAMFLEGLDHFEAGDLDAALRSFRGSYELVRHPETLYNIAGVLSRLGRYREAIAEYDRYLAEGGDVPRDRRMAVAEELARLRGLLGLLELVVEPAGAAVSVDGAAAGTAPLDAPVAVDPGSHIVEARLAGYEDARTTLEVAAGGAARAELRLQPLPAILTIVNIVEGAAVEVDGTPVPAGDVAAGVRVTPGRHLVSATADGFEPVERVIDAQPGANLRVELPLARLLPAPRLRVVGSEGAVVFVDGERAGELPWEGEVAPGDRLVAVEGEGLHRWEGTVAARRGDVVEVQVRLGRVPSGPDPAWIWSVAGVAAAAGAAALGFGVAALDANATFDDVSGAIENHDYGSDEELFALQERGRSAAADARDWSLGCDVSWGIAAAGAAAALLLLLLHDGGEEGPTATFSAAGETGLGVGGVW
jgi:hypothetical protein